MIIFHLFTILIIGREFGSKVKATYKASFFLQSCQSTENEDSTAVSWELNEEAVYGVSNIPHINLQLPLKAHIIS